MPIPKRYQPRAGQGSTEYVLIGLCVAVISIAGLILLGNTVKNSLGGILSGDRQSPKAALAKLPATTTGQITMSAQGMQLTTAKGTVIALPDVPKDLGITILTSGANGTTDLLADSLHAMAKQLKDAGDISEEEYNALIALANKAYEIAEVEKKFEEIAAKSKDKTSFIKAIESSPELMYSADSSRGYEYNLGYNANYKVVSVSAADFGSTVSVGKTKEFMDAYQAALKLGSLSDPAVKQVVSLLSENIVYLSQATSSTIQSISKGEQPVGNLNAQMASTVTNQDASQICTTGNGQNSDSQCSL